MNLKKYLQQQAEKDVENLLTEEDRQFCMRLAEDVQEKPVIAQSQKPKTKFWACLGSAIAVALVAVIVIPVALTHKPANEVYYKEENIEHKVCQLEELNADLDSFMVIQLEDTVFRYGLFYDKLSNDSLYYEINVSTLISKYNLYIIVNDKYNYDFSIVSESQTQQLSEYSINYQSVELSDVVNKVEAKYKGVVQLNNETVYIEYDQLIDLGEQAFFEDIQNVLKVKN